LQLGRGEDAGGGEHRKRRDNEKRGKKESKLNADCASVEAGPRQGHDTWSAGRAKRASASREDKCINQVPERTCDEAERGREEKKPTGAWRCGEEEERKKRERKKEENFSFFFSQKRVGSL
jgi:hypothetical protein